MLLAGVAVVLSYCSSVSYLPSHQNIIDAQDRWPQADSVYLYRGYEVYQNKCSGCHYLHNPSKYSEKDWHKILPEMRQKAKLTDAEFQPLKTYLMALSQPDSLEAN